MDINTNIGIRTGINKFKLKCNTYKCDHNRKGVCAFIYTTVEEDSNTEGINCIGFINLEED